MFADQHNPLHPQPAPPAANCWYLSGPTAAGKTQVGVELALAIGAEIVSLDSMALYQGLDIGTAKPSRHDQGRVPHHLLDIVSPTEEFSLGQYIDAAHESIAAIRGRGKEVLFVGGTPLYLKALLRGVHQGPPADWGFRRQIDAELQSLPDEALHERLQVIDPLLAARLHPNDKRRIVRGLEVYRLTGQRLSHLQTQFDEAGPASQAKAFVLSWPRDELHRRIDGRVDQMFAAGLVDEVHGLLHQYGTLSRTAMQAVGYREVIELLHSRDQRSRDAQASGGREPTEAFSGDAQLTACIDRVKARTRQFARRQETWFRSLSECRTVAMHEGQTPAEVAARICESALGQSVAQTL